MRRAVLAEWTKLRTVPSTAWLLLAVAGLTAAIGAGVASGGGPLDRPVDPAKLSLTGVWVGQAAVAVLAVLSITSEYATRTIRTTLAADPRRVRVLAAKAAVVSALVLAVGSAGVAGALLAGRVLVTADWAGAQTTWRAAVGTTLYLGLVGLLSLGLGSLLRDSTAAIATVLGLLYLFPMFAGIVSDPVWQERLNKYGPNAGLAIQATRDLNTLPIGPWAGLGVLALYAAAAMALGTAAFRYGDVRC